MRFAGLFKSPWAQSDFPGIRDRNGGAANDENRGRQGLFQEGGFAHRHRRVAVLYFQIRLHEGWGAGSSPALDTLRPALRHPSDVRVDRARRGLPGRRRRAVRAELRDRRPHRRLRPGVAPAGGGTVCAPHHLPPDYSAKSPTVTCRRRDHLVI